MGRGQALESGYYEDDEDLEAAWGEPGGGEPGELATRSGAWGISLLVHGGLLLILAAVAITAPAAQREAVILASLPAPTPPEPDPERERALERAPELKADQPVEHPILQQEELDPTQDVPEGDPQNFTDKDLRDVSRDDAFGTSGPGRSGAYGQRWGRGDARGKDGSTPESEDAVDAALRWLREHQEPDGRWSAAGWGARCGRGRGLARCAGPGVNEGMANCDVGVTALALLAYLGRGNSHRFGLYKATVQRGLRWLKAQQDERGAIGWVDHTGAYNHAIATLALCESYAVTRDFTIRRQTERAVSCCLQARNPGLAWRYEPRSGQNDTSVTGWMVLALKAARVAGLEVPEEAFAGALAWLDRASSGDGQVGYLTPGGGSSYLAANEGRFDPVPCMTAVGVLCRLFCGERRSADTVRRGALLLDQSPPAWGPRRINFYYWYYATYALFQVGGERWLAWRAALLPVLLGHQRRGGCEDGSWDPEGEWCAAGGRVYATAINCLTLESFYRYARQSQEAH